MTWDPYGMPHAPRDIQDKSDHRLPSDRTPVSPRAVVAILAGMALLAVVLSVAANAQDTTTQQEGSETVIQQQGSDSEGQQEGAEAATKQEGQQESAEAQATTEAAEGAAEAAESAEAEAAPFDGQIVEQPEGTYAVSDLVGSSVMSAEGENMGQISDLLAEDDRIAGAVIGVGGFLGFGEKPIAIEIDRLQRITTEDGGEQWVLDVSRQQLERAPQFVSLEEQRRQQEAEQARQMQEQQQGSGDTGYQLTQ